MKERKEKKREKIPCQKKDKVVHTSQGSGPLPLEVRRRSELERQMGGRVGNPAQGRQRARRGGGLWAACQDPFEVGVREESLGRGQRHPFWLLRERRERWLWVYPEGGSQLICHQEKGRKERERERERIKMKKEKWVVFGCIGFSLLVPHQAPNLDSAVI